MEQKKLDVCLSPSKKARETILTRMSASDRKDVENAKKDALDPSATPQRLTALSKHWHWRVRLKVASHPNTTTATMKRLCEDTDEMVSEIAQMCLKKRGNLCGEGKTKKTAVP